MTERRVAVTGLGVTCAIGSNRSAFARALRSGVCGIAPLARPGSDLDGLPFGAVGSLAVPELARGSIRNRADQLAAAAILEAVRHADWSSSVLGRAGLVLGVGAGGADALGRALADRRSERRERVADLIAFPPAGTADRMAQALGCQGPVMSIMTACSAGAMAIGCAADLIRNGRAEAVLAGGAEPMSDLTLSGFSALRALSPTPCRPFDRGRMGTSLGEGAAILALEDWERACARGAPIWAELAGWGASCDAHHMTAPAPDGAGAARAIESALTCARTSIQDVGYINAHGTGTIHNDVAESRAIERVFGALARRLPVGSTKSQVGHTLGAAGAIEAVATIIGLGEGFLPATVTLEDPDPECALDHVKEPRECRTQAALSSSFGFGGNNVALALRAGLR